MNDQMGSSQFCFLVLSPESMRASHSKDFNPYELPALFKSVLPFVSRLKGASEGDDCLFL